MSKLENVINFIDNYKNVIKAIVFLSSHYSLKEKTLSNRSFYSSLLTLVSSKQKFAIVISLARQLLSKQNFSLSKQNFSLSKRNFSLLKRNFSLSKRNFLSKRDFSLSKQVVLRKFYSLSKQVVLQKSFIVVNSRRSSRLRIKSFADESF